MFSEIVLKDLEIKKRSLPRNKKIDLIITDFDDTIFSRSEQLEKSELLKNNRGNKGNDVIKEIIGIENAMDMFYVGKTYPTIITSKLRKNHDLILTAGYEDIQIEKLKACKLHHINYRIVSSPEEKIIETIKYVVEKLKFIPSKIIIYEDRPKYFVDYKTFLEDFFGIDIDIMIVEMTNNHSEPKIKKLEA